MYHLGTLLVRAVSKKNHVYRLTRAVTRDHTRLSLRPTYQPLIHGSAPPQRLRIRDHRAAKEKREANKGLREARKEWEATLVPWAAGNLEYRHKEGTHVRFPLFLTRLLQVCVAPSLASLTQVMFKTDARKLFGLTEKEISTLPYESSYASWGQKSFYALKAVRELHRRKVAAGVPRYAHTHPDTDAELAGSRMTVLVAAKSTGASTRKNFNYITLPRFPDSTVPGADWLQTTEFTLAQYDRHFAGKGKVDGGAKAK
uniref:Uncharacterized protein n=1 Tax=Mycena chlorophos TaxID=658473 RepID=A0ABQ0LQH3_MYCCL|nr:predicted protein [Mycena chlorophos]